MTSTRRSKAANDPPHPVRLPFKEEEVVVVHETKEKEEVQAALHVTDATVKDTLMKMSPDAASTATTPIGRSSRGAHQPYLSIPIPVLLRTPRLPSSS